MDRVRVADQQIRRFEESRHSLQNEFTRMQEELAATALLRDGLRMDKERVSLHSCRNS